MNAKVEKVEVIVSKMPTASVSYGAKYKFVPMTSPRANLLPPKDVATVVKVWVAVSNMPTEEDLCGTK